MKICLKRQEITIAPETTTVSGAIFLPYNGVRGPLSPAGFGAEPHNKSFRLPCVVRAELESGGYLRSRGKKQAGFQRASKPREYRSSAGLRIFVGRSNSQNDKLTKNAQRWDIWLHTQKIHGSHVILCTDGTEPDERSLYEAAVLAAYYSQGRESGKVSVDYTPVRYVKKPAGSRPGMVVYTTYQTMSVAPDETVVKGLKSK
jgi:predicted ribosome quality control (RQC) complex YloA/Tae2 family protein